MSRSLTTWKQIINDDKIIYLTETNNINTTNSNKDKENGILTNFHVGNQQIYTNCIIKKIRTEVGFEHMTSGFEALQSNQSTRESVPRHKCQRLYFIYSLTYYRLASVNKI